MSLGWHQVRRKEEDQGQSGHLLSNNGVMGVSLPVFIGPKFAFNGENLSSWHQQVLTHEDLSK